MIKYSKLPENIEHLLPVAQTYLKSRGDVLFAYIFGSLAKGEVSPLSDVDISVYLTEDADFVEKKMEILDKRTGAALRRIFCTTVPGHWRSTRSQGQ